MNCENYSLDRFVRETKWAFNPPLTAQTDNPERKRMVRAVLEVMRKELSEKQLDCFRLVVIEDNTVTEAANMLGVNKSTVSRHLNRAKEKIRQALKYSFIW